MFFLKEIPIKMDDLGVLPFLETYISIKHVTIFDNRSSDIPGFD